MFCEDISLLRSLAFLLHSEDASDYRRESSAPRRLRLLHRQPAKRGRRETLQVPSPTDLWMQYYEAEHPELEPLLRYLEDNYVGRRLRRGRGRQPVPYPPSLWSQFDAAADGLPITTNELEAYHRSIDASLNQAHPTPWKLLDWLKKQVERSYQSLVQLEAGLPLRRRASLWIARDEQLKNLVARWDASFARDGIDRRNAPSLICLRAFAHFFSFARH